MSVVRRFAPVAAALLALPLLLLAPAASAQTAVAPGGLQMNSDQGDYIGQGRSYSYPDGSVSGVGMTATSNHFAYSFFDDVDNWWTVLVSAPAGQSLVAGASFPVQRDMSHDLDHGGLDVFGVGRGCNTLTGTVTVNRYDFYRSGSQSLPKDIDISFTQHCEGASPALTGRVVWTVATSPGVHPVANTEGDSTRTTTYGSTVPLNGFGPTNHDLGVWFHRAGTVGYAQLRTLFPDSTGAWSTSYVATDDYRIYVRSQGDASPGILVQIRPTVDGPTARVVRRASSYQISGTGNPGARLTVYYHRAGTSSTDYSIVRTVSIGADGHWSRASTADTDYRFFVKLPNGLATDPVLVQAR